MTFLRVRRLANLREVLALLWSVMSPYVRTRLAISLALVVATGVVSALTPAILKLVIDAFAQTRHSSSVVLWLIGLYVFSQWLAKILLDLRGFIHAQADRRIYSALSDRLFSHVMRLPLRFHLERRTGAINELLSNGLNGYQTVLQTTVNTFIPLLVELGTVAVILITLDQPVFIGLFAAAMVCYAAAFGYGTFRVAEAARTASNAQVDARSIMTDSILNYETVKYFTAESMIKKSFERALFRTEVGWVSFFARMTVTDMLVGTIFALFLAATILYAGREVLQGRMSVGTFVLVNTYMIQLVRPVESLGFAVQQLAQGLVFLESMSDLFRHKAEEEDKSTVVSSSYPDSRPALSTAGLTFENVSASYRTDRPVLRNVSFDVEAGKTIGIVGASGAGKTTIVRLLMRFLEPDAGRILMNGAPITELALQTLRQAIAVVPQDTVLFNDTIGYNIAFGRPDCTQKDIEAAAKVAQLHDYVVGLASGYETRVGERGVKLSGGERQRVSIARAILKRPQIFLFDEATSALDTRTERDILHQLYDIARHTTTVVIAHRLSTIMHADAIVVLSGGTVIERGTHAELLKLKGRYFGLWEAQQSTVKLRRVL